MQREILFGQRNFETFSYYAVQGIFFFSLYFLKSVIRKCVFSLKEIKKGPRRASLIVVKYIYTSSPFYVFTCCLLLFAPVACFHPHYFGWH